MHKYEKGISKVEVLLVLLVILLPALYVYISEFLDVKKEKESFIRMEQNLVKKKVDELIQKNKKELLPNKKLSYLNCTQNNNNTSNVCDLNLEALKKFKLVSSAWMPVLREYPNIAWKATLSFKPSKEGYDIISNVYPERTPDYTAAAINTLNTRLLSALNKTK